MFEYKKKVKVYSETFEAWNSLYFINKKACNFKGKLNTLFIILLRELYAYQNKRPYSSIKPIVFSCFDYRFHLVSLINGISTFEGHLISKRSLLKNKSDTI